MEQPKKADPITEEHIQMLAIEISKIAFVKSYEDGFRVGALIKNALNRAYRRGYVAGLADKKGDNNG